jgi:hypothetical protein
MCRGSALEMKEWRRERERRQKREPSHNFSLPIFHEEQKQKWKRNKGSRLFSFWWEFIFSEEVIILSNILK